MGPELDPVRAIPQQSLLGNTQSAQLELGYQPAADTAVLGPDCGGPGRAAGARSSRAEQPRAFGPARMLRMLGLEQQLVAGAAGLEQLSPGPLVLDPRQRPAAGRVGLDQVNLILKPERGARGSRLPAGLGSSRFRRADLEAAEPDPGHFGAERQPDRLQSAGRSPDDALGQERHRRPGVIEHAEPGWPAGWQFQVDAGHRGAIQRQ